MNNRIMAMLVALVVAMFVSIVPVEAEAATCYHQHKDAECYCAACGTTVHVWEQKIDAKKHYQVCKDCGKNRDEGNHVYANYVATAGGAQHTAKCTVCGHTITEDHNARANECRCEKCLTILGHDQEWKFDGQKHWQECAVCNDADGVTAKEDHKLTVTANNDGVAHHVKCATCGYEADVVCADSTEDKDCLCDVCKAPVGNAVHKLTQVEAVAKTCTTDGMYSYKKCDYCGKIFHDGVETTLEELVNKAPGKHNESTKWFNDETAHWHVCKNDGCEDKLSKAEHTFEWRQDETTHWQVCTVCGFAVNGAEHDYADFACNEGDTHSEKCSVCGKENKATPCAEGEVIDHKCDDCGDLLIHAYDRPYMSKTVHKTATCTEDGIWLHKQCEVCGLRMKADGTILDETTMVNPKTGHTPNGVWEKDDKDVHYQWCAKNCGEHAVEEEHKPGECKVYPSDKTKHFNQCTVCYKSLNIEEHIDENKDCKCDGCGVQLKHDVKKVNWQAATCEEDGWIDHRVCTICGTYFEWNSSKVLTAEEVILPAIKHQPNGKWEKDDKDGHYQWCANDCGTKLLYEAHTAGDWKEYPSDKTKHFHQCTVCYKTLETAEHNYVYTRDEGTYNHNRDCADCGQHSYITCTPNADKCACVMCDGLMLHTDKTFLTYVEAKPATCEEAGHTDYYLCNNCGGTFLSDGKPWDPKLEALDHDWKYLKNTTNGQHLKRCNNCKEYTTEDHMDLNGDCTCDINNCGILVHVHTIEHVEKVPAKCGVPGTEDYFIYQPCGRMLDKNLKDIAAPAIIPALEHEAGNEYEAVDGDLHANLCKYCGEAMTTSAHADKNNDNRCDVCKVELALTYVPQQAPTCTDVGYEGYWISEVTGRKYADANGNQYITSVAKIPATGHKWTSSEDIYHVCGECGQKQAHKASAESDCVCGICEMEMKGHNLVIVDAVAPTCTKTGTDSYIKCDCGALYDIDGYEIAAPAILYATGHNMGTQVKLDKSEGDHYIECLTCGYELHEDHKMAVEDPLKGNYHQWVCECGEVETAKHSDSDGDNKCDECKHVMTSTSVTVEQHDNKTVVTGDASTIKPNKSWWQNWLNNLKPGNAAGNTTSKPAASESAPVVNNQNTASSGSSVNTGNNAPVNTNNNAANIIGNFMQWLGQLFGSLLR